MFSQTSPIRVEHQPSVGAELVFEREEPPVTPRVGHAPSLPVDIPAWMLPRPAQTPPPDTLTLLLTEVRGLRADLASRTLSARLRRLWTWIRQRVYRF